MGRGAKLRVELVGLTWLRPVLRAISATGIPPFFDDHQIVITVHANHMGVGIAARSAITELLVVQSIEEILDHAHGGGRVFEVSASTEARPI